MTVKVAHQLQEQKPKMCRNFLEGQKDNCTISYTEAFHGCFCPGNSGIFSRFSSKLRVRDTAAAAGCDFSCLILTVNTGPSAQTSRGISTEPSSTTSTLSTRSCMQRSRPWARSLRRWTRWCRTSLLSPPIRWYVCHLQHAHTHTHRQKQTRKLFSLTCWLCFRRGSGSTTL